MTAALRQVVSPLVQRILAHLGLLTDPLGADPARPPPGPAVDLFAAVSA